ncbi:FAD-dependent oxidoreductase [Runella sp.]|uniref:FAD-dependent oxidoreductase n=1 Tax=Runella sp. TaxID=1960881 RepID=UPI003D131856
MTILLRFSILFSIFILPLTGFHSLILSDKNQAQAYDVVIYGATAGGITAAIQVAKMGKTVALIEPSKHIGGMSVEGLGGTDIDNHKEFQNTAAVGGSSLEFYRRIAKAYGHEAAFEQMLSKKEKNPDLWDFESKVAEKVFNDWVKEYKINVFLNHRLSENKKAVQKNGTNIVQIQMENGNIFRGKVFIDATIEGDLLAKAGVSTTVGREANSKYNETLNGIRAVTDHAQFKVKVNPYRNPDDPKSGLIPMIQDEPLGTPGAGDKRLQAFCFRMCLTKNPTNQLPFTKPDGYDRTQYEIYLRYLKAGGKLYRPDVSIPNGKTDLGAWHDLSHNLYGMNMEYPEGSYAVRERILKQHRTFTQGLFYFLAHDAEVAKLAPELQKEWALWGLAKDEFTDNGGWPRQFYVRDARRMVSDYVITEHHVKKVNPIPIEDPVGMAYWPTDVHSVRRIVKDGYAYNEGSVFEGDYWRPLPISYQALVPKASECTNLFTPTCPSSSHIAYGAIRLEWTFMILGQSTGAAAVLAIDKNSSVQKVDYQSLKQILLKEKQVLAL